MLKGKLDFGKDPVVRVRMGAAMRKVRVVEEVKLLGVRMGVGMNVKPHVMGIRARLMNVVGCMRRVLRKRWGVKRKVWRVWMTGLFEAIVMYGAGVWGKLMEYDYARKELGRCQRVVLYACLNVCRTVSTLAMQVLAGSPPWYLLCRKRRTLYRVRKELCMDELDMYERNRRFGHLVHALGRAARWCEATIRGIMPERL
ncbi:unnamed protein product [Trichogramma brassicae]|uniref:Uncharacterized protein n=1 Tax=Trichogramma brassicae TaxID=86971 RepID=A0A6H5IX01_9HYME|nr:unnamed protein product [Trichogramma brassicae]